MTPSLNCRRLIGCEIDLISRQQEPALTGLGCLHRISQLNCRDSCVTRRGRVFEIGLCAFPQPKVHGDDRHQGDEPDEQKCGG